MEKVITIDGQNVNFKATAGTPRRYRMLFRRDLMQDMLLLSKKLKANKKDSTDFESMDLEMFENVAYIMAKQADNTIADNAMDWLDNFKMFDIYEVLPQLLELWGMETETHIQSKKNLQRVAGK